MWQHHLTPRLQGNAPLRHTKFRATFDALVLRQRELEDITRWATGLPGPSSTAAVTGGSTSAEQPLWPK